MPDKTCSNDDTVRRIVLVTIDYGLKIKDIGQIFPVIYEIQPTIVADDEEFTGDQSQYFSVIGQSSRHSKRQTFLNTQKMLNGLDLRTGQYSIYSGPLLDDKCSQRELLKEKQPDLCPKYTVLIPNQFDENDSVTLQNLQALWDTSPQENQGEHPTKSFVIKIPGYNCGEGNIFFNELTEYSQLIQEVSQAIKQQSIDITEDIFGFPTSKKLAINTIDTPILIEQCSNQTPPGVHRAVYRVVAVCDIDTRKVEVMPTTIWPLFRQDYNSHRGGQNNTCFDLVQDQIYLGSQLAQQLTSPNYAGELEGYYRIFQETQSSICSMLQSIADAVAVGEYFVPMTISMPDEFLVGRPNGYATFAQVCALNAGGSIYSQVTLKYEKLNTNRLPACRQKSRIEKDAAFKLLLETCVKFKLDSDENLDATLNDYGQKVRKLIWHYEIDGRIENPTETQKQEVRNKMPCEINQDNCPKFFAKVQECRNSMSSAGLFWANSCTRNNLDRYAATGSSNSP